MSWANVSAGPFGFDFRPPLDPSGPRSLPTLSLASPGTLCLFWTTDVKQIKIPFETIMENFYGELGISNKWQFRFLSFALLIIPYSAEL
jgi:hypothetical protein